MNETSFQVALDRFITLSPEEQASWIEANGLSLSDAQLAELSTRVNDIYRGVATADPETVAKYQQVQNALASIRPEKALAEQGSAFVQQGKDAGMTDGQIADAADANGLPVPQSPDPRWLMDQWGGGNVLSDDQRKQIVDYYNDQGYEFGSYRELVDSGIIDNPPPATQEDLAMLLEGKAEPFSSLTIPLGKGRTFSVASDEWEEAAARYGYDSDAMTRIVRMADANGMRGADGEYIAWQPFAALLRATGWQSDQKRQGDLSEKYQSLYNEIQRLEDDLAKTRRNPDRIARIKNEIETKKKQLAQIGNSFGSGRERVNPREIAGAFNEGLEKFNYDPGMAFIYAQDPGLAARIQATNGDIALLTGRDRALISRYVGDAGYNDADEFIVSMLQQGYAEADTSGSLVSNYLKALELAAGGGGSGRQRILPDPVQVQQAAKDLYRSLFLEDPDEATLANLSATVSSAISSAPDNQNVDVEARIRQSLEGSSKYREYYGKKPGGMTEAEYRTMFGAAQQSMLGNETAGNAAVKVGMRDGQYQTAVGATMGLKEAWNNSTFMGRLAQAAEVVGRNT